MKRASRYILFTVFIYMVFCLWSVSAYAQTEQERIEQLREQIEQLEAQSKLFKNNIASERAKAKTLAGEISVLKNQISILENQVKVTGTKIDKTKIEVTVLEANIFDTENKIQKQKSAIGQLVLFMNRQDNQSLLATLLKTGAISEFFQQNQYAANLSTSLMDLIGDLNDTKSYLEDEKGEAEEMKADLEQLQGQQAAQKAALSGVRSEKSSLLTKTKGKEAEYQKQLSAVERQRAEFFTELQKLENEAIAGGLYIVHVTAANLPPRGTNIFSWPYDAGSYYLTQSYGRTAYSQRGAYGGQPHSGVDIAAGFGTPIRPIGAGEILAFGNNVGFGNWIAVKHDNNMVSIYGHMSSYAGLRVGARVTVDKTIGFEGSTGNSTGSHVHLSLYRDFFTYEKKGQLYFNYYDGTVNPLDYLP